MPFTITTREAGGPAAGTVYTLASDAARIEVWPSAGFNCLRWQVRTDGGGWGDLLDVAPDWDQNPVPTRSGHPVLFPFPNRLREGKIHANGRDYQLPLTESTKKHAIHGLTPRNAWRVVNTAVASNIARITADFQLARDVLNGRDLWPADFVLRLTYFIRDDLHELAVAAIVTNPDAVPLPWGLGYHPYFKLPGVATADEFVVRAATASLWHASEGMATGDEVPTPPDVDFRTARLLGETALDHLCRRDGSGYAAEIGSGRPGTLTVSPLGSDFRELLLFTPPHRRSLAVEPYTCTSDAATLSARGIDSGWRTLAPGESWYGTVIYRYDPTRTLAPGANAN